MAFIKTHRFEFLILFIITLIFFGLRLPNLTLQPIFADEAIYIRWAQVMRAEPTLRFVSVSDGKTPLFMWILIPFFKIFNDPLFAGRFLSILSGYATLLGVTFLGFKYFSKRTALLGAFLVAIIPFTVFFDRMALVDSMLSAFTIWSLIAALLLIEYQRIDLAMVLGYFYGGGMLTKTPGSLNIFVLPATLALFNWSSHKRPERFLKIFGLWLIALVIAFGLYNILRLGPQFEALSSRNQDYVFSPTKLLTSPLDPFIPHVRDISSWIVDFFSIPAFLLLIYGILLVLKKKSRAGIAILLWSFGPLFVEMALLKTFTARYILFTIPPMLLISAYAIDHLFSQFKNPLFKGLIILIVLIWPVYFNFNLLFSLENTPLPANERRGYLEDWTAGYGLQDIAKFLMDKAQNGLVVVGTEGSFGTLPDGLEIYTDKYGHSVPQDKQIIFAPGKATVSAQLRTAALEHPTYYVANGSRYYDPAPNLTLINKYPKIKNPILPQDAILIFQVFPDKNASASAASK